MLWRAELETRRPKAVIFLPHTANIIQESQLPLANIVYYAVQCNAAVVYSFRNRWVLFKDFDGVLDIELSHSGSARVIVGQTLKFGLVLSA